VNSQLNKMKCFGLISGLLLLLGSSLALSAETVIPVTTKTLQQLVFHPVKKAPAQVVTLQNSLLSSELSALVLDVSVQVGDRVKKDQTLVKLECIDFELLKQQLQSEQKALEADHQFAEYQFERSKTLLKSKSVSQESHRRQQAELHRLMAQKKLIQSKIRLAEKRISRCIIKAPFDGVIAQRQVNMGENVTPGTPLIRLIDVDNLEVEVQVPVIVIDELDYTSLDFIYREQRYPLALRAVIPSIETRARHQRVRLTFVDKKALPDAFGMVEITRRDVYLPASYLVARQSQVGVFIVDKRSEQSDEKAVRARFYPLKNALIGRDAAIELPMETELIIEGRHALTDGQVIEVKPLTQSESESIVR
jgi:RND family efflux transporter MFP subunit